MAKPAARKAPVTNVFAIAPQVTKKPAGKKNDNREHIDVKGLEFYAALTALAKEIKTLIDVERPAIDDILDKHFIAAGLKIEKRPESVRGVENGVEASCEFRKRGENSPLKPEEADLLRQHNLPFAVVPVSKDSGRFVINPAYEKDSDLMTRVGEAIGAVEGLPRDFIMQATKEVVTDETIDQMFKLKPADVEKVKDVVRVLAIKPAAKFDIQDAIAHLVRHVSPSESRTEGKAE